MAKKTLSPKSPDETTKLLRDLIIVELGLAGVAQKNIRVIAGVDMGYVNKIVKLLPKKLVDKK